MRGRRLTARFVETVSTDLDREAHPDCGIRGLELRVTKLGRKSWTLRYRRKSDGKLRRLTLGTFPTISLEEARQTSKEHLAAIGRRADPAGVIQDQKKAETFAEIVEQWIERHGRLNKAIRTLRDDQAMLRRHVLPRIGAMKARDITKRDIVKLLDHVMAQPDARYGQRALRARSLSAAALISLGSRRMTHRPNRVFQLVRSIFRWAVSRDELETDPTAGLKAPIKHEPPRERELSPTEIRTLWQALDKAPTARDPTNRAEFPLTKSRALVLKLALVTAQRIGEVTAISNDELALTSDAPVWTVPSNRSKNKQINRVPLSPLALRLIAEARNLAPDSRWLFPRPDGSGPINPQVPTKALERARAHLGVDHFRVHDLRRTAATRMAEFGINPYTIALVLNHISARQGTITARVYVKYSFDREKREALESWGRRVEGIVGMDNSGPASPPTITPQCPRV